MIADIVLLLSMYSMDIITIWIAVEALFDGKVRKIWIGAGYIILILLYAFTKSYNDTVFLMSHLGIVVYFLMTYKPPLQNLKWQIQKYLLLMYQGTLIGTLVSDIIYHFKKSITENEAELIGNIVSLIVIAIFAVMHQINRKYKRSINLLRYMEKIMFPMLVFVLIELMFQVVGFDYVMYSNGHDILYLVAKVVKVLSIISVGILILIISYIQKTNKDMERMVYTEKQMQQQQVQYYETLLQREQETKKYRHDMNGHIICLTELIEEGNLKKAKEYINDMMKRMQDFFSKMFQCV